MRNKWKNIFFAFLWCQTSVEDCKMIVQTCIQSGVMLSVGHVLRYDPTIHKIKVNICLFSAWLLFPRL